MRPPNGQTTTTTITALILGILFGVFEFEFDKGFGYLENFFKCEFECEFNENFDIFGDLLDGTLSVPQPQRTYPTLPTPYPTPPPTPNPREFCLLGGENNVLLNENENENFLENEINIHFEDFENGM